MDNESLTMEGLVMGRQSLGDRQDSIFGGKRHGGALVFLPLRKPWRIFSFVRT
jgi:hypothetical protein